MGAFGSKLHRREGGLIAFLCPGCEEEHHIRPREAGSERGWSFNEDGDRPTFFPSILVTGPSRWLTDEEHERVLAGEKVDLPQMRCHSYVSDGRIQFLSDCTHELAGQTVDLPDWPS